MQIPGLICNETQSETMFPPMVNTAGQSALRRFPRMRWGIAASAAVAALAVTVAGCGSSATSANTSSTTAVITVIGAENEYANVLGQIGGRYVQASAILDNPNTDPHTFEASPSVAQKVSAAQLIVQNGVGYDTWISRMESASPNPNRKVIVVQHLLGLPDSTPNPHLWYDPATMPKVAKAMAADLSAIQPAHAAYFQANLQAFDRSLTPWRNAIAQFKAKYPNTKVATTEPVADYLLSAMGIKNLTPFTFQLNIMNGVEPAPQDIALENSFFTQHKVKAFAYNQQVTSALTTPVRQTAQSWMLAEVEALQKAVASKVSTQRL